MAALVHPIPTPFGTVASATASRCAMGADALTGSYPLTAHVVRAWNGQNPALRCARCMR